MKRHHAAGDSMPDGFTTARPELPAVAKYRRGVSSFLDS
jgi:hypothetical protein